MTQVTKTFVATDGTDVVANDSSLSYVGDSGADALQILSNKAAPANNGGATQGVYLNGTAFAARQKCSITIGGSDAGSGVVALVRCDGTIGNSLHLVVTNGAQYLFRRNSGTETDTGNYGFSAAADGDVFSIEINAASDTVTIQKNGTDFMGSPITVTPAQMPNGTRIGAALRSAELAEAARLTQFVADDFADTVPESYSFTDVTGAVLVASTESNAVVITGITAAAPISITGGEYQIDGGSWVSSAGTVANGGSVKVRVTASATPRTTTSCTLNVGGVTDTFSVTTGHARSASSGSSDTLAQKTVTITKPSGATLNDVIVADIIDSNNDTPGSWGNITSTGWTVVGTPAGSGAGGYTKATRLRRTIRADTLNSNNAAAEPASYTFTTSYGGTTYRVTGSMVAYAGIDPNTPEDVTSVIQFNSSNSTNIAAASLTPVTAAGTVLVTGYAGTSGETGQNLPGGDTVTAPGTQVERVERFENNRFSFSMIADESLTGTTATGTRTGTIPSSRKSFGLSTLLRVNTGALGISTVSTDNVVNAAETAAAIVGTGFGASQGTGGVSIIQGAITIAQTVASWGDTLATFDAIFEAGGADFAYGPATLRLTIDGGSFTDFAITLAPALGNIYATIATPDLVNGIQTTPALATGDQIEARGYLGNAAPSGLTITDAGVPEFSGNSNHFQVRVRDVSDGQWSAWEYYLDTRLILTIDTMAVAASQANANLLAQRRVAVDTMAVAADLKAVTLNYQSAQIGTMPVFATLNAVNLTLNRRLTIDTMAVVATLQDVNAPTIVQPLPVGGKPLPPQGVTFSTLSPQRVRVNWSTQVDHGGSGLDGFNVYRSSDTGFTKLNALPVDGPFYDDDPPGDDPARLVYYVTTVALNGMESDASPRVEVQTENRTLSYRIDKLGRVTWVYT